ncbi:MAG: hypothetical protein JSR77_04485 [Planctomycetes bacterium]|nr:hypothetical protein [Planctomycetota bacterium]
MMHVFAALMCSTALATPLTLSYQVEPIGGGLLRYHFTLTLDNHDGTWANGQSFNWITWGDVAGPGATNLPDFVGDPPAPDPFNDPGEGFTTSGGGHNGPTLLDFGTNFDFHGWVPTAIGDSLVWSGTSAIDLQTGDMLWSNLIGTGLHADFEVAVREGGGPPCPADYDQSGGVDGADVEAFYHDWENGEAAADTNLDGSVDGADVETFFRAWEAGGC